MEIQNTSPFHQEPVNGAIFLDFYIYNCVLGYGKTLGFISKEDNPTIYRLVGRVVYSFLAF